MSNISKKVTIIGDVCQDIFIYGKSERLSPEAPVPIFEEIHRIENSGMAGNVLANLESLCINDTNIKLKSYLSPTYEIKTRYIDDKTNHIFLRVDTKKDREYAFHMTFEIQNDLKSSDLIIISDYDKRFLSWSDILEITSMKSKNALLIIDTKKKIHTRELLNRIDYIKMNGKEFEQNKNVFDDKNIDKLIVTLGEKGSVYKDKLYTVEVKQTIDVSGAGDTFLASLSYSLLKENNIVDAINFANEKASLVVTKRGVSVI